MNKQEKMSDDIIELLSSSSNSDNELVNDIDSRATKFVVLGVPAAKKRPEFMAWIKKGKLFRRVVNRSKPQEEKLRREVVDLLQQVYNKNKSDLPLIPEGGVVLLGAGFLQTYAR